VNKLHLPRIYPTRGGELARLVLEGCVLFWVLVWWLV